MKKSVCFVCNKEFYGRNNQVFCSIECKNYHHNQKTRMYYQAGKLERDGILRIQKQAYANNRKNAKALEELAEVKAWYKGQIAVLKTDYSDLLRMYQSFYTKVEKEKAKGMDLLETRKDMELKVAIFKEVSNSLKPVIEKIKNRLDKM